MMGQFMYGGTTPLATHLWSQHGELSLICYQLQGVSIDINCSICFSCDISLPLSL